jgi:hypothetical protein
MWNAYTKHIKQELLSNKAINLFSQGALMVREGVARFVSKK